VPNGVIMMVDKDELKRVFDNLILNEGNAIKKRQFAFDNIDVKYNYIRLCSRYNIAQGYGKRRDF